MYTSFHSMTGGGLALGAAAIANRLGYPEDVCVAAAAGAACAAHYPVDLIKEFVWGKWYWALLFEVGLHLVVLFFLFSVDVRAGQVFVAGAVGGNIPDIFDKCLYLLRGKVVLRCHQPGWERYPLTHEQTIGASLLPAVLVMLSATWVGVLVGEWLS
jgi:hypothetical protein